jgi:lipopolysaccharide transport system permease protein
MDRSHHVVRVEPPGRWHLPSLGELVARRELLLLLAWRDISVRYKQTLLGAVWAILQPVLTMIVFTLIFGRLGGLSSEGIPYALFSLGALVPWTFFANSLILGGQSMVVDVSLVTKVYFPRLFIPLAMMVAGLVDLAIAFGVLLVTMVVYGRGPSSHIVVLPLLLIMLFVGSLGPTLFLAALNVRYRDVRYAVPFLTQLWLFSTPVAYSANLFSDDWRLVAALNPMTGVVEGFRWAVLGSKVDVLPLILISSASAVVLLAIGLGYFARVERTFADIV